MKIANPLARGNKFKAERTACRHGHMHASKKEARRCNDLHLLERAGEISNLQQQPVFKFTFDGRPVVHENGRALRFTPDFQYFERGRCVVEDAKGVRTEAYVVRAAFFRAFYPDVELREV